MMDEKPELSALVSSASNEAGTSFEIEPFAVLAYDAMAITLIIALRDPKVDRTQLSRLYQWAWDEMFMLDLYPANRKRFGVDVAAIVSTVDSVKSEDKACNNNPRHS
jgi:hypothetical protein